MPVVKIVPMPGPSGSQVQISIDGGRAGSIYTVSQVLDGGNAAGQN